MAVIIGFDVAPDVTIALAMICDMQSSEGSGIRCHLSRLQPIAGKWSHQISLNTFEVLVWSCLLAQLSLVCGGCLCLVPLIPPRAAFDAVHVFPQQEAFCQSASTSWNVASLVCTFMWRVLFQQQLRLHKDCCVSLTIARSLWNGGPMRAVGRSENFPSYEIMVRSTSLKQMGSNTVWTKSTRNIWMLRQFSVNTLRYDILWASSEGFWKPG